MTLFIDVKFFSVNSCTVCMVGMLVRMCVSSKQIVWLASEHIHVFCGEYVEMGYNGFS